MAMITWKNINQPSAAGAGILMNSAQRGVNNGFNVLQNVLAQRNKTEQENWQTQKANNTSDYLDAVQGVSDPAQLQDPAVQANLANLKQQFGYQVDSNAIRGAVDNRADSLRVQGTNQMKFNDLSRVDSERDAVDRISALYQAGNYAEADALRQGQNFRDDALLDKLKVDAQRGYSQEGRAVAQDGRAAASHGLNMANGQVSLASNRMRLEDQQETGAANDIARQFQNRYLEMQDHITAGRQEVAKNKGIDLNNIQPGQLEVLQQGLKEAGVPEMPSSTEFMQQAAPALLQSGTSIDTIRSLQASLGEAIGQDNLTEQDKTFVQQEVAAVGQKYDSGILKNTAKMEKIAKTNSLLKSEGDPYEQQANIQAAVKKAASAEAEQEELSDAIKDVTVNGVEVDGVHYTDIPQSMILAAVNYAGNQGENIIWDFKGGDFTRVMKTMASDPKFAQQWKEFDEYNALKEKNNTLSVEKNAATRDAERKLRAQVGGKSSMDALNRALNNRK